MGRLEARAIAMAIVLVIAMVRIVATIAIVRLRGGSRRDDTTDPLGGQAGGATVPCLFATVLVYYCTVLVCYVLVYYCTVFVGVGWR